MENNKDKTAAVLENLEVNELDELKQKNMQLEAEMAYYKQVAQQVEDLSLSLEVANERWVKQVNENTSLEVELRKLRKVNK